MGYYEVIVRDQKNGFPPYYTRTLQASSPEEINVILSQVKSQGLEPVSWGALGSYNQYLNKNGKEPSGALDIPTPTMNASGEITGSLQQAPWTPPPEPRPPVVNSLTNVISPQSENAITKSNGTVARSGVRTGGNLGYSFTDASGNPNWGSLNWPDFGILPPNYQGGISLPAGGEQTSFVPGKTPTLADLANLSAAAFQVPNPGTLYSYTQPMGGVDMPKVGWGWSPQWRDLLTGLANYNIGTGLNDTGNLVTGGDQIPSPTGGKTWADVIGQLAPDVLGSILGSATGGNPGAPPPPATQPPPNYDPGTGPYTPGSTGTQGGSPGTPSPSGTIGGGTIPAGGVGTIPGVGGTSGGGLPKSLGGLGGLLKSLGGLGGIISGGILLGNAAGNAASEQSNAYKYAADLNKQAADEALAFQKEQYKDSQGIYRDWRTAQQPYLEAGMRGVRTLEGITQDTSKPFTEQWGMPTFEQSGMAPTAENFQADPSYQFRLQEGQKAIERAAAAKGGLYSGATGKALTRYAQDVASQEFGNIYGRKKQEYDDIYSRGLDAYRMRHDIDAQNKATKYNQIANIAGLGQVATGQLGSGYSTASNSGNQAAGNLASILQNSSMFQGQALANAGTARASGIVGRANNLGDMIAMLTGSGYGTRRIPIPGVPGTGGSWGGR